MAKRKIFISLSDKEKAELHRIIEERAESERAVLRAKVLLMSDQSYTPKLSVVKLAEELGTSHTTIQTIRQDYATGGMQKAVYRKARSVYPEKRKVNPSVRKQIRALAASDPPVGHKKWTLRLIAQEAVRRNIVDHISHASVHRALYEEETTASAEQYMDKKQCSMSISEQTMKPALWKQIEDLGKRQQFLEHFLMEKNLLEEAEKYVADHMDADGKVQTD